MELKCEAACDSLNINKQEMSLGKTSSETDGSDVIECSITESFPVPKIKFNQISKEIIANFKTNTNKNMVLSENSNSVRDLIRLSLKQNFQLLPESLDESKKENFYKYSKQLKINNFDHFNSSTKKDEKLLSSLKKNARETPYLSKVKLKNVQQWLQNNNVEKVTTPPFANFTLTPRSTSKKRFLKEQMYGENSETSSIDSDVEEVLKAVYGNDWSKKSLKCKTEPKKLISDFTPLNVQRKGKISLCTARRSLLKCNENDKVSDQKNDDSIISGIKSINLDDSTGSVKELKDSDEKKVEIKRKSRLKSREAVSNSKKTFNTQINDEVKNIFTKNLMNSKNSDKFSSAMINKTPKKTFLASLSVSTPNSRSHPEAAQYKINFKSKKNELIRILFKIYNTNVFDDKLPNDMNFSWNIKLRGTAGYCYNKRITKSTGDIIRISRIEFSTKIVDRADRLRDTMIHELCHAAAWIVNGTLDGHGAVWSDWATKAAHRFPELPKIRRCHNYDIMAKYIYKCMGCGYSIKRHSKSINTERKRCGYCFGTLELFLNKKRKGPTEAPEFDITKTLRTPNKFAMFVKENYRSVKTLNQNAKHAEIMKVLSEQYALTKNKNSFSC